VLDRARIGAPWKAARSNERSSGMTRGLFTRSVEKLKRTILARRPRGRVVHRAHHAKPRDGIELPIPSPGKRRPLRTAGSGAFARKSMLRPPALRKFHLPPITAYPWISSLASGTASAVIVIRALPGKLSPNTSLRICVSRSP